MAQCPTFEHYMVTFLPSGRHLNMERKSGMGALLKHRAAVLRKYKEGH